MASDVKIKYDVETQEFDFEYNNGDLLRENGLETAVLISLFTDRRADDDDNLINDGEYRGWWGDALEENDQIGSKLWLIKGGKSTNENIVLAKQYIQNALQWMIDDGVAAKIDVNVERKGRVENNILAVQIKVYYTDGNYQAVKFDNLWTAQIEGV